MCRWFAYISPTEPCLLEDVLISPKHSLVKQVHEHYLPGLIAHHPKRLGDDHLVRARNNANNIDGVGVAWYTSSAADFEAGESGKSADGTAKEGLRPAFYKSVVPPINDFVFKSICANTETKVCFGHIRATSGTPIIHVNNHPFIFGRHTCMHNGGITGFHTIRRAMTLKMSDAAYEAVLGSTDSEHLFGLYITYLTKSGDKSSFENEYSVEEMAAALHDAVATICALQNELIGDKRTPNSLNLCVTDGNKLVAYRFRNHASEQPPSLYYSTKAGTTLNRKYPGAPDGVKALDEATRIPADRHGRHLIVASEPTTYQAGHWNLIGRNQMLLADPDGGITIEDIPYEVAWNAVDPDCPEL